MIPAQHIILIGFKHAGKSTIGRLLAQKLGCSFFDSDREVESFFYKTHWEKYNCREIMEKYGADLFRKLETNVLRELVDASPSVIALGGGTVMHPENQRLIAPHIIIQITAPPEVIFKRIMKNGRPAFFPPDVDPRITFSRLWEEREAVYHQLTSICIENDIKIYGAVEKICHLLDIKT